MGERLAAYMADMRDVPGGAFQMGSDEAEAESPPHAVTLSPFRLGRTPVTVAVWKEYVAATERWLPDEPSWGWLDDCPMVNVSWVDAQAFCAWASEVSGVALSLPTEAQWEFAARGVQSLRYPWGDDWGDGKHCTHSVGQNLLGTMPVGSHPSGASWCGCLDLSGNVWEWCADWFDADYYGKPAARRTDPTGPSRGKQRTCRGGAWSNNLAGYFRGAARNKNLPVRQSLYVGFRLCAGPR